MIFALCFFVEFLLLCSRKHASDHRSSVVLVRTARSHDARCGYAETQHLCIACLFARTGSARQLKNLLPATDKKSGPEKARSFYLLKVFPSYGRGERSSILLGFYFNEKEKHFRLLDIEEQLLHTHSGRRTSLPVFMSERENFLLNREEQQCAS